MSTSARTRTSITAILAAGLLAALTFPRIGGPWDTNPWDNDPRLGKPRPTATQTHSPGTFRVYIEATGDITSVKITTTGDNFTLTKSLPRVIFLEGKAIAKRERTGTYDPRRPGSFTIEVQTLPHESRSVRVLCSIVLDGNGDPIADHDSGPAKSHLTEFDTPKASCAVRSPAQ